MFSYPYFLYAHPDQMQNTNHNPEANRTRIWIQTVSYPALDFFFLHIIPNCKKKATWKEQYFSLKP